MALNQLEQSQVKGLTDIQAFVDDANGWQKPSDWIDIRSGALPNSVYFLVGHSADYTKYPTFRVQPTISNSGTYDVFVDGIKVATTASNTATVLDWQTLALQTGWNVTYPEALLTHIVRITPTLSANQFTKIGAASSTSLAGLLWAHLTISYSVNAEYAFYYAKILEAVSVANDRLLVSSLLHTFHEDFALKEVPVLDGSNASFGYSSAFRNARSIKQLTLKNMKCTGGLYSFSECNLLKKVVCENASFEYYNQTFNGCNALQEMPVMDPASAIGANGILIGCTSLYATLLDFQNATGLTSIQVGGSATNRIDGVKGLIVSNQATFDGASPQINVSYTGLDRSALVNLFNSMPYNVGYTVVGSPTIANGVASGFSASDYLQVQQLPTDFWTKDFEICVALNTPTSWPSGDAYLLKGSRKRVGDTNNDNGIVTWWSDNKLTISGSYKNTSGSAPFTVEIVPELSTKYFMKVVQAGHTISGYYSLNGSDWTLLGSADDYGYSGTPNTLATLLGQDVDCAGFSIDLNNTYININGVPWFRGTAAMTKTCNIVGCTGEMDLSAEDKAIVLQKGWELTTNNTEV